MIINIPPQVLSICQILKDNGFECYLVGGSIRNSILNIPTKDYDLATNSLPENTIKIFEEKGYKVIPTGIKHGTITVDKYEITTYRSDGELPLHKCSGFLLQRFRRFDKTCILRPF